MRVPYLDLRVTEPRLKNELLNCVANVLDHGRLIEGPEQAEFEQRFAREIGVKYAIGVSSGSSALYLALRSSGIGAGDEVITSPFTWVITVNAIRATGAKPVFVDIAEDFNIDVSRISRAITKKTKAIVPMHVAGHMCDMKSLSRIAKPSSLLIIEDAAQAFCASLNGKRAGTFSVAAGFSMNPMKILHAYGEAGVVVTNRKSIFQKVKELRHAGIQPDPKGIDINRCMEVSLNHKIDTIQAAMLMVNLNRISKIRKYRGQIADLYDSELEGYGLLQPVADGETHGRYIYLMACSKRNRLRKFLFDHGIETKVFYSPLVCDSQVYREEERLEVPMARKLLRKAISIPFHENMTMKQAQYVASRVKEFFNASKSKRNV